MREIKFRAKLWDTDIWVYGGGIHQYGNVTLMLSEDECSPVVHKVKPETIGQKMCNPDCKGNEVYEGDVLKRDFFSNWCITWHEYGFYIYNTCNPTLFFPASNLDSREVIGNIHDNPKLLEV